MDGKLTRHDESDIYKWTSDEDHEHFRGLIAASDVLVMGRGTYEAIKAATNPNTLRLVLTTTPQKFQDRVIEGQLEFYNETPAGVAERLSSRGYKKVLIVGGTGTISPFLASQLVDYFYLSVEPYIFGEGKPLAAGRLDSGFRLVSSRQLNERGTMLLTYKAVR